MNHWPVLWSSVPGALGGCSNGTTTAVSMGAASVEALDWKHRNDR